MVHGVAVSRAVREVNWQGGPLADAQYDEFSLQIKVPDATGKYYFKVSQVCEQGSAHWNEAPGAPGAVMQFPAPCSMWCRPPARRTSTESAEPVAPWHL